MTPTEQRIAIAEAFGWTGVIAGAIGAVGFPPGRAEAGERRTVIPAYTEDLNAMHEAEAWMEANAADRCYTFLAELRATILREAGLKYPGLVGEFRLAHATAKQRAEAFLRTLNLWKEEV